MKRTLKWILIGIVGLFVVGTIATLTNGTPSHSSTPTWTAQAATEATVAPALKWVTVTTLAGSSNKRGPDFLLSGAPARLTYHVKGDMVVVGVYIVETGHSLQAEGGIPEVLVNEAGSDTTRLAQGAGSYYLDVTAANASWTVSIEEQH